MENLIIVSEISDIGDQTQTSTKRNWTRGETAADKLPLVAVEAGVEVPAGGVGYFKGNRGGD